MQNNVTELTHKLLRSLDNNYNVLDMPSVIEVISFLEKISITKEVLETTRLGKHVNQLRKTTTNEALAKRAKELVKKWRNMVLPTETNGQVLRVATAANDLPAIDEVHGKKRLASEPLDNVNSKRPRVNGQMSELEFSDNSNSSFKEALMSNLVTNKVQRGSGGGVIVINSDSNSSLPDVRQQQQEQPAAAVHDEPPPPPTPEEQQPPPPPQPVNKKRGRKKGSKSHKNLIEEAETSFSNKLNVSRGNAKVKTTKELLADLHKKSSSHVAVNSTAAKPIDDVNERVANLTERVSMIDRKLHANSHRFRNSQKRLSSKHPSSDHVIESGIVSNCKSSATASSLTSESRNSSGSAADEEVIIVDDVEDDIFYHPAAAEPVTDISLADLPGIEEIKAQEAALEAPKSLSIEEASARLPPIDRTVLYETNPEPFCSCHLKENKTDFSTEDDEEVNLEHTFEFVEDGHCSAKLHLGQKYRLHLSPSSVEERVQELHASDLPNVNGNDSIGVSKPGPAMTADDLYVNIVPNVHTEHIPKFSSVDHTRPASENFKKYSISEDGGIECENGTEDSKSDNWQVGDIKHTMAFREWHEVVETPSYDGEILRILPYVIID